MDRFIVENWQWLISAILSIIGIGLSALAFWYAAQADKYARRASEETNVLIKRNFEKIAEKKQSEDELEFEDALVDAAVSEWRRNGTAENYLTDQFVNRLKKRGWDLEKLDKIHERTCVRYKGRPPKQKLSVVLMAKGIR